MMDSRVFASKTVNLQCAAPKEWGEFMEVLKARLESRKNDLLSQSTKETLFRAQGHARELDSLVRELGEAPVTVERLDRRK